MEMMNSKPWVNRLTVLDDDAPLRVSVNLVARRTHTLALVARDSTGCKVLARSVGGAGKPLEPCELKRASIPTSISSSADLDGYQDPRIVSPALFAVLMTGEQLEADLKLAVASWGERPSPGDITVGTELVLSGAVFSGGPGGWPLSSMGPDKSQTPAPVSSDRNQKDSISPQPALASPMSFSLSFSGPSVVPSQPPEGSQAANGAEAGAPESHREPGSSLTWPLSSMGPDSYPGLVAGPQKHQRKALLTRSAAWKHLRLETPRPASIRTRTRARIVVPEGAKATQLELPAVWAVDLTGLVGPDDEVQIHYEFPGDAVKPADHYHQTWRAGEAASTPCRLRVSGIDGKTGLHEREAEIHIDWPDGGDLQITAARVS